MITLRPRQEKAKKDVRKAMKNGARKVLLVAPPGFGKTPTSGSIMEDSIERSSDVLFMVHRNELIMQMSKTLNVLGLPHGILKNKHPKFNLSMPIQLSSWQTMKGFVKTLTKIENDAELILTYIDIFKPKLIIYDEAHRSVAEKAKMILNCFPDTYILGLTGTPYRDDGRGLGSFYEVLVPTCSTIDLIKEGLIIQPAYYWCNDVMEKASKFIKLDNQIEIEVNCDIEDYADLIIKADVVRNFKKICPDSQAVVFCTNTEQAEIVAQAFLKGGVSAKMVECKTKNRDKLLSDFANKEFQIITNASLLAEGWDYPPLECVINLRRCKSRVFYRQASNRCMRIAPDKSKAYILDFFNLPKFFGDLPWSDEGEYTLEEDKQAVRRKKREIQAPDLRGTCNQKLEDGSICNTYYDLSINNRCLGCGVELAPSKMDRIIVEAVDDLVKADEEEIKQIKADKDEKQAEFNRLCSIAMNRGLKPGWVGHKYKEKFGVWPKGLKASNEWLEYKEDKKK